MLWPQKGRNCNLKNCELRSSCSFFQKSSFSSVFGKKSVDTYRSSKNILSINKKNKLIPEFISTYLQIIISQKDEEQNTLKHKCLFNIITYPS